MLDPRRSLDDWHLRARKELHGQLHVLSLGTVLESVDHELEARLYLKHKQVLAENTLINQLVVTQIIDMAL